jgi:hypothetical protein
MADGGCMTTPATFFNQLPEPDVKRGVDGSPRLIPRGLEVSGVRADYTRASYMADFVEDKQHIHRWEMRYLAKAMGQNEDLAALAACEGYSTGISDAMYGRSKTASGRRLDDIIERAFDRVRIHEKADRGTAVHGFTEPGAPDGTAIPERLRPAVGSFWQVNAKECVDIVGTEIFTANDATMSAGTFDHLVTVLGHPLLTGLVVADKKTGNFDPLSWCVQISTYAHGDIYKTDDDTRPPWPGTINLDYGLVWQIDADNGTTKLWIIDIAFGWEVAKLAAQVRDIRKRNDIATDYKAPTFDQRLTAAKTAEELRTLWYSTDKADQHALIEQKARLL